MVEITRLVPKEKKGLVVVITGHGKGKTTTALGIAVRACGHDMKVSIIQFMKGDLYAGEWDGVKKMNCRIELIATGVELKLLVMGRTSARPPEQESAGGEQEEHIFVFWYGIPPIPNTQEFCEAAVRNGV